MDLKTIENLTLKSREQSKKNTKDLAQIAQDSLSINKSSPVEVVSFCDESAWEGTIVDDTVNTRYGEMGKQVTAAASSSAQLTLIKNINAANKLFVIDFYSADLTHFSYLQIMLQINGSWSTYARINIEPKVDREFRPGWNRIVVNPLLFKGVSDIAAMLDKISGIRLKPFTKDTGSFTVTFDRVGLIENPLKEAIITFTFDDGNATDYTIARPYMSKYSYTGVSYIIPMQIDTGSRMTIDQLKGIYESGWDVSAHGWTHTYDYPDETTIKDEMIQPYEWLVNNGFTRSADHMAFPGGVTNDNIEAVVKQIYKTARTTAGIAEWSLNTVPVINPYRLRAVGVTRSDTVAEIKEYVDKAIASKAWLIFMFHDLGNSPTSDGWVTANFQALIDYVAEKQVTVKTMSEMSNYMPDSISGRIERQTRYSDIEIADATKGVILTSPNGSKYRMTIGDDGTPTFGAI